MACIISFAIPSPTNRSGLTYMYNKKGWDFISDHPQLRCLEKPMKRMESNTTSPILALWYLKAQYGAAPIIIKHQGRAYHTYIHCFRFACSFPDFEHETDKAKICLLGQLAILRFYTEPPIGITKLAFIFVFRVVRIWYLEDVFDVLTLLLGEVSDLTLILLSECPLLATNVVGWAFIGGNQQETTFLYL